MKTNFLLTALALITLAVCIPGLSLADVSIERQTEILRMIKQDCSTCHGDQLQGKYGPPLLPDNLRYIPDEYLVNVIKNGRPGRYMPAWITMLNQDEIYWLVNWLKDESRSDQRKGEIYKPIDKYY